jgi:hypothetical protein
VTVAVKVTEPPKLELAGPVTVVVLARRTARLPVAVLVPLHAVPTPWTVKLVVPAGVAPVVEIVSVEV